jgi:formylglycine-generating enzyme required for sulfatase activity
MLSLLFFAIHIDAAVGKGEPRAVVNPPAQMILIKGGSFRSVLPSSGSTAESVVPSFHMDRVPVTNADFLRFVRNNPQWRRGAAPSVFVDGQYLKTWEAPLQPGPDAASSQPVTSVSWFAARAYCEARAARLPTWLEWEFVAAADESRADARATPAWQQEILSWYSRPSTSALPSVGAHPPNFYGVQDLHGLIWEWVDDFNALMIGTDARKAGDGDKAEFCGAGALALGNRDEYAIAMRIAMLSALQGRDTTGNLGFRCVTP